MTTTRRQDTLRRAITLALIAGAASSVSFVPSLALAAEPEALETVIVTGSNIRRADIDTAAPVQVVTRADVDLSGKTTLGEYLQTLTADGAGSVPKSFGTGFAAGASGISLRGLGSSSTLVLLNGRRIAPFGLADDGQKVFTDISVIPLEAVERVEVLKDGASAIYGSDAIAGVVNVILREEYQGIATKATLGASGEGDGETAKLSLTGGFGDLSEDRYNVYFNLEGGKTESIAVRDRKGRDWIGSGDLRRYGYAATGSQFLSGFRTANGTSSPAGNIQRPDGTYESLPGCAQLTTLSQDNPGAECIWDSGQYRDLTPEQKYGNFFARGTFAISDSIDAYAEGGYSHKESFFHNTPSGVSGSWGYPGGPVNASSGPGAMTIGAAHPDNTYPGAARRIRYLAWDVGPRTGETENDFWRALAGVKGSFGDWDFDMGVLHSESEVTYARTGFLRYSAVQQALSGAGPITWRIGDNASLNNQAVYDYISPKIQSVGENSIDAIDAKVTRSLFALPGGELGFAVGAEYRKLKTSLTPTTYTDIGDIIGLGYSAFDGTQEVTGTYVEFLAPVFQQLEISAAVRYDRYAGGLDNTSPKFGVRWSPSDIFTLRGTYAEGFRAPNAPENGDGGLAAFTTTADPVRCPGGTPRLGAQQSDCNQSVALITSPNPDLKPEKSENVTIGFVLQPLDATTLTVDAWQIKRTDEINSETIDDAILAGRTVRSDNLLNNEPDSGTLLAALAGYINSAETTVRGIDFAVHQRFDVASGRLNLDATYTRMNSFKRVEPDGTVHQYAGTHGNCDVTNCIGTPKDRINLGATFAMETWSIGSVVNYRSAIHNKNEESATCANRLANLQFAPTADCTLRDFYTVDLTGRWNATEAMQVFGTVENLLDKVAPLDPRSYGAVNYNPLDASGAIGRYFTLGLSYSF